MFKWLRLYGEADPKTRYFILIFLINGLAILITAVYCYARLDYVRSYRTPAAIEAEQQANKKHN